MPYLRQIRRASLAAFLVGTAVSLAACDVVINSMDGEFGGGRARAEQAYAKTFTLDGPGATFELVNMNGGVTVEAVDGNVVDVKATIRARAGTDEAAKELLKQVVIKEDVGPGRLRLETTHPRLRQSIEARFTLRVPRGVKIDLHNTNGVIDIAGMKAGVKAETTNGGVKARGLWGSVDVSTTNGGIDVQMAGIGPDGVRLETTNGGIDLRLPADTKATLAARCVNGGVSVTDLPFVKDPDSNRRRVDGTINGGGPVLKLETVNGGVRIRPAGAVEKGKEGGNAATDLDRLRGLKGLKALHAHAGSIT